MDLLNMQHINSLPQPFMIRLWGDKNITWPLDHICVETGLLKFDVCGLLQLGHIRDVAEFIDSAGIHHDSETFYSDYEAEEATCASATSE